MTEKTFQFGKQRSLVGILTLPENRDDSPPREAVLLLNSGLIHRVGPSRLYVNAARRLAAAGFAALRFDFAGIGDSPPRSEHQSLEQQVLDQIGEALDFLNAHQGIERFLLTGICAGGDAAFLAAVADRRITAIAPIDLYSYFSTPYLLSIYRRRLVSRRSWRKFFTGRSDIISLMRNGLRKLSLAKTSVTRKGAEPPSDDPETVSPERIIAGIQILLQRKVLVHLIYSDGSPAYFNYRRLFEQSFASLAENNLVNIRFFKTVDHGFTLHNHREQLIAALLEWAKAGRTGGCS